ncbi:hypothetical protein O181_051394 [Austropuccinia psidii MF-1]|uniref:Uncharacterized protein n=1 Tax=Austropuccinia psidii MF-1 TaxID=1389203 RepID=A0A9Q3DYR0_9BASI|nr:hypothetical protein [Austropuccinia psidii MF-1]
MHRSTIKPNHTRRYKVISLVYRKGKKMKQGMAILNSRNWVEWGNRNLPPSSEYHDYIKNKIPQVNNLRLGQSPDFWKIDDETENKKRYIWKEDERSNQYMKELNEKGEMVNKRIYESFDTNGTLYHVLVDGSEVIEGVRLSL